MPDIMDNKEFIVCKAQISEFEEIGNLLVEVYSKLDGFPKQNEQPDYYNMLKNVGEWTKKPCTELLIALSSEGKIAGAVVYFSDMQYYGSGGTATEEQNASGFRLLAVTPSFRGNGIGKLLTNECIRKARLNGNSQVIIHTTKAMQTAWKMYETIGFKRSEDLDFMQGQLPVFGFRLMLNSQKFHL
jgi:GNAT superfamily N-acetyltransferase